ncbi:MAG TPA: Ldh family oxidoreductase [Victivallales bacterium]|nr:Ldh family oxidoreductase [Victivallales bacterium]
MKYDHKLIELYTCQILEKYNIPSNKAKISAKILVEADLRGIFSHGINNIETYVIKAIENGGLILNAESEDINPDNKFSIRHIDANGELGHCSAMFAVNYVKKLARKYGYGKVYVSNANHFGAAGIYSEEICKEKDLSGRVCCTTLSCTVPYGGNKKRLGTNPLAWSIPYNDGIITIDMATTTHAISGLAKAVIERFQLPFPAYDNEGNEILDSSIFSSVEDFYNNSSMVPLGALGREKSKKADAGYKGTGLATLIELDSVIGSGPSTFINPTNMNVNRRIHQTFEAWRVDTCFSKKTALNNISKTIKDIRQYGGDSMLMPGEKEHITRRISIENGIPYTNEQINRFNNIRKNLGLSTIDS